MLTRSHPKTKPKPNDVRFVICIENEGYEASLERLKLYLEIRDSDAKSNDQVRVIDESGEDYLYPNRFFATIDLPQSVRRVLRAAV